MQKPTRERRGWRHCCLVYIQGWRSCPADSRQSVQNASRRDKEDLDEPVIPDLAVYAIGGFVMTLVIASLLFMAYVMISEGSEPRRDWEHCSSSLSVQD